MAKTSTQDHSYSKIAPPFWVIIPAAGEGQRFGDDVPKQYHLIHGKTVLRHAVEMFHAMPECCGIYVAHSPSGEELCHRALEGLKGIHFVCGGSDRKSSVHKALESFSHAEDEGIVLVHDAARPCLSADDIRRLLCSLETYRAASLALPVSSTLLKADEEQYAQGPIDREQLWAVQTPQAFRYCDLMRAHGEADPALTYTDDTQLVSALGVAVGLVAGSAENIKITWKDDLDMAEKLLTPRQSQTHSGLGFDVHAFDLESSGPVRLCGVDVPHDYALKGHSDADVGLHALCDALYGALGSGDIGRHFPPSDQSFKGMDSARFLEHAVALLAEKGGALVNADITLICEEPKITPYAQDMRTRIAEICSVAPKRINVKATTTERLGFTGRKEGIAAQVIVSIMLPNEEA